MIRQPIIAGIDGSQESVRAASLAWRLARAMDAQCVLVHAVPNVWAPGGMAPLVNSGEVFDLVVSDLQKWLSRELGAEIPDAVRRSLVARPGRPDIVLDQVAREYEAGLIVVGARHHGALARGFGGSTAHRLVRTSPVPVLVAQGPGQVPRRILVATELSPAAAPTLSTAWRYADLFTAQLRVVHVFEPAKFRPVVPLSLDQNAFESSSRRKFDRLIALELPRVAPSDRIVRRGKADEEIAEEAVAWQADLVVVGTHGTNWVDRMLIGSTTERLLNRLPASLLVVPVNRRAARASGLSGRRKSRKEMVML